jgi:DNA polymerase-3 subunit gamma/tau
MAALQEDPFVKSVMTAFPGAEIVALRKLATPEAPADGEAPVEADDED